MPPTFIPFMAFMAYIAITAVALVVFMPMLVFTATRLLAKKALITVLISLPCLITVAALTGLIFLLPALLFSWLAYHNYIPRTPGIILFIAGLFLFIVIVAASSLYLWYFFSQIIYKLLEKRSPSEFIHKNKVAKYLQRYIKFNDDFFNKNSAIKILGMLVGVPVCAIICALLYFGLSNQ
jgi:hypothetical protein